jgi:Plasmid recombination enzyme
MAASFIFKLDSIVSKRGGVLAALKHNKRTLQAERGAGENINVTKTPLNYSLTGNNTPEAIATHAKVQMLKAGIETARKNGVMAVEVIFSLPIDRHSQDTRPFFSDCYTWVKQTFACELLSFDVHLDEAAPHAHAVILPLIDGKMQGDKLKGNKANIRRLTDLFHAQVAGRYGLSKSVYRRLSSLDKQALEKQVLTRLKSDPAMQSCVWACFRDDIHKDPMKYAQVLSIGVLAKNKPKPKTFVQIMTSIGKGNKSPIGNYA